MTIAPRRVACVLNMVVLGCALVSACGPEDRPGASRGDGAVSTDAGGTRGEAPDPGDSALPGRPDAATGGDGGMRNGARDAAEPAVNGSDASLADVRFLDTGLPAEVYLDAAWSMPRPQSSFHVASRSGDFHAFGGPAGLTVFHGGEQLWTTATAVAAAAVKDDGTIFVARSSDSGCEVQRISSSGGEALWTTRFNEGSQGLLSCQGLALTSTGAVIVSGPKAGQLVGEQVEARNRPFVSRIEEDGSISWAKQLVSCPERAAAALLASDDSDSVYVSDVVGGCPLVRLDTAGRELWSSTLPTRLVPNDGSHTNDLIGCGTPVPTTDGALVAVPCMGSPPSVTALLLYTGAGVLQWGRIVVAHTTVVIDAVEGVEWQAFTSSYGAPPVVYSSTARAFYMMGTAENQYFNGSRRRMSHDDVLLEKFSENGMLLASLQFRHPVTVDAYQKQPSYTSVVGPGPTLSLRENGELLTTGWFSTTGTAPFDFVATVVRF